MIGINSRVWIPRSNGTEVIGTVRNLIDRYDVPGAYCTWEEPLPSNVLHPETAISQPPCVRMVKAVLAKWVPVAKLRCV